MSRGLLGGATQPQQYEYSEEEDSDTEEYLQSRLKHIVKLPHKYA